MLGSTETMFDGSGALRVGLLIDGNGGPPLHDAILQVDRGVIGAVGRAEDFGTAAQSAARPGQPSACSCPA